jgi:hypothetical protein
VGWRGVLGLAGAEQRQPGDGLPLVHAVVAVHLDETDVVYGRPDGLGLDLLHRFHIGRGASVGIDVGDTDVWSKPVRILGDLVLAEDLPIAARTVFRSRLMGSGGSAGMAMASSATVTSPNWASTWGNGASMAVPGNRPSGALVYRSRCGFTTWRHSYATWLVSDGVPINDVAKVMGHEQTSTTLNRYTHSTRDRDRRVLRPLLPTRCLRPPRTTRR